MKNEDTSLWGARIERGRITVTETDANSIERYTIESIDRPGVTVYGLPGIGGPYSAGTQVYFFAFEDGKGYALCAIL